MDNPTIEQVRESIESMENHFGYGGYWPVSVNRGKPIYFSHAENEAIRTALHALRRLEAEMEPVKLTLEQLREMDGEPVWCINRYDNIEQWGIARVRAYNGEISIWGPSLLAEIPKPMHGRKPRDRRGRPVDKGYAFYAHKPAKEVPNE